MAESRDAKQIQWIQPKKRGIFPIGEFHISKSLRRALLKNDYSIKINSNFPKVIEKCADRNETGSIATFMIATASCTKMDLLIQLKCGKTAN